MCCILILSKVFYWGGLLSNSNINELDTLSNEVLVEYAQAGNEQAMSVLSARFLNTRGTGVSVAYLDSDDFVQEGMIGFLKAVNSYDPTKSVPFEAYAFKCMQNSINTAAGVYKREVAVVSDSELPDMVDTQVDPLNKLLVSEELSLVLNTCKVSLTETEKTVVFLKAGGLSYGEIALRLGMSEKNVDNAIQRARRKLKELCAE